MIRRSFSLLLPALLLLPSVDARRGGWATVTVDDLPDQVETARPLTLTFIVRQHGITLLKGLHPTIEARSGGNVARADAEPGKSDGQYVVSVRLAQPGDWTITINSGFGTSKLTLLPIRAVSSAERSATTLVEEERGRRLFVSKGCVGCHTRADVDVGAGATIGPVLTGKRWQTEFLRRFLADPAGNATLTGSFRMPNLGLKQAEIAYLAAFLNADRTGGQ